MTKRAADIPLSELMGKKDSKVAKKAAAPTEHSHELEAELQALDSIQGELTKLEEAQADEVMKVVTTFQEKKKPVYDKRAKAIEEIPEFWFHVLVAHPHTGDLITDVDQDVMTYLTRLDVIEVEGTQQDYRLELHFSENPFFSNKTLWKSYAFHGDDAKVECSPIEWKKTDEAKQVQDLLVPHLLDIGADPDEVSPSFFSVFCPEDRDFQLGDVIKQEIWPNPLEIYMSVDFSYEDEAPTEPKKHNGGKVKR